ncbi:hypothetical protein EV682_10968 [Iodobacter fluviatilis]|jgi:hypothetical protein|uniref:Uncharacterized protein n=2 Tax=Iodobacter TaxID=32014 RepID=A0A377Q5Y0_9NEIS|nr:hypothetical protein [Iodobacter violacea]NHQ86834.1 hypothetical protein [Iodobacter violacea]TCU84543.1 hypothetical protein EV682_10968 [Iodobacter fluviatilis]STQ90009.1 Uncharacterised protein [Iodobacter fluviatilis]
MNTCEATTLQKKTKATISNAKDFNAWCKKFGIFDAATQARDAGVDVLTCLNWLKSTH